ADGATLVTTWAVPDAGAAQRSTLVAIDTATGERRVRGDDPAAEVTAPRISPDGAWVAYVTESSPTPEQAPVIRLRLVALAGPTADDAVLTDVSVAPDGATVFALRTSYAAPAEPVRVDLAGFRASGAPGERTPVAATLLRSPVPAPALPGRLTEVETTTEDGVRVRAWLALPADAGPDAKAPLLLWIHGGPLGSWNVWSWRWNPWLMVAQGYAV